MEDLNLRNLRANHKEVLVLGDDYISCTETEDVSEQEGESEDCASPSGGHDELVEGNVYDIDDDEMQFNPHFSMSSYAHEKRHHTNEDYAGTGGGMLTPESGWDVDNPYLKISNPPSFGGNSSIFDQRGGGGPKRAKR